MASKIKVDTLETANGSGTIALSNQLSGMTTASLPALGSAQMPTGSVLQVVSASLGTSTSTTSTSFIDTPLALAITPTSTSSKILIKVDAPIHTSSTGTYGVLFTLFRGTVAGTNLGHVTQGMAYSYDGDANTLETGTSLSYLDSPNTTSAQTYTLGMRSENATSTGAVMLYSCVGTITLMEIAG